MIFCMIIVQIYEYQLQATLYISSFKRYIFQKAYTFDLYLILVYHLFKPDFVYINTYLIER
jgi:hypothetical protein